MTSSIVPTNVPAPPGPSAGIAARLRRTQRAPASCRAGRPSTSGRRRRRRRGHLDERLAAGGRDAVEPAQRVGLGDLDAVDLGESVVGVDEAAVERGREDARGRRRRERAETALALRQRALGGALLGDVDHLRDEVLRHAVGPATAETLRLTRTVEPSGRT